MKQLKDIYSGTIYGDQSLLENAPKTTGTLEFFKVGKYISSAELQAEYEKRKLTPANPYELARWCEENQDIGAYYVTQWSDNGFCYASFYRWRDERRVNVYRCGGVWYDYWVFAGVPRVSSELEPSDITLTLESLHARLSKIERLINPDLLASPEK